MTEPRASAPDGLRPIVTGMPMLYAEAPPVYAAYFGDARDAFDAMVACDRLGFGYELVAYQAPIGGNQTQSEWRLTAWAHVEADCAPILGREEQADDATSG